MSYADQRRAGEEAVARVRLPPGIEVTPSDAGGVPAELIRPERAMPGACVVHLHGGAYVMGSFATVRPLAAMLATAIPAAVLSVGYRLAPEHVHPAAVHDAVRAYEWLLEAGQDPALTVMSGDSAGGGLAVATAVALRDRGLPLPAGVVCFSPWSDLTLPGASIDANAAHDPLVPRWMLEQMAGLYAGASDLDAPLISPVFADLAGVPPLLIHAGGAEALVDDACSLAAAAERAGVGVQFECWPHMIHVWHAFAPGLAEGSAALARAAGWIVNRWRPADSRT